MFVSTIFVLNNEKKNCYFATLPPYKKIFINASGKTGDFVIVALLRVVLSLFFFSNFIFEWTSSISITQRYMHSGECIYFILILKKYKKVRNKWVIVTLAIKY